MEYRIKRVGYWSMVKFYGIIYLVMGFIMGGFWFLYSLFSLNPFEIAIGIAAAIFLTLGGFVGGAITGLLVALFYNIIAFFSGGIEMSLEQKK